MRTAIVIPAYNEGPRLGRVLEALRPAPWEVIVVNDGSADETARVARSYPGVQVVDLAVNRGKGGALWAGARAAADAEVLVFLDADLEGLRPAHVEALLAPVCTGAAEMSVGFFCGGRRPTDFSHRVAPWVSGQRAIRRDLFLALEHVPAAGLGVEVVLTREARRRGWRVERVPLPGLTHSMKEEKLGPWRGLAARCGMYGQIARAWCRCHWSPSPPASRRLERSASGAQTPARRSSTPDPH